MGVATAVGETAYDLGSLAADEIGEAAKESFEEETNMPLTDRNLTRAIAAADFRRSVSFSSYGFIDKETNMNLNMGEGYIMNADKTSVDDQMGADKLYREGLEFDTKTAHRCTHRRHA